LIKLDFRICIIHRNDLIDEGMFNTLRKVTTTTCRGVQRKRQLRHKLLIVSKSYEAFRVYFYAHYPRNYIGHRCYR